MLRQILQGNAQALLNITLEQAASKSNPNISAALMVVPEVTVTWGNFGETVLTGDESQRGAQPLRSICFEDRRPSKRAGCRVPFRVFFVHRRRRPKCYVVLFMESRLS
ncbi:hypothetical protein CIHG_04513 [Coccidioides immitis H538.4]|uniref:Uncharacterized protein n=3 Tax=Coccidioides immitis TaxID=5501 RepID=A0A0J8R648_COCIT|nr:hypothetical protein CIRG_06683 [Coccidioides immitis RMSCC 2394]KMU79915.1 hypothetical protein CISG_08197 [Coccidioides immitis RMSCC 3703]KMU86724.1 hypothetical protein CIHG_04513 [Coccidioides immitis H538.4]